MDAKLPPAHQQLGFFRKKHLTAPHLSFTSKQIKNSKYRPNTHLTKSRGSKMSHLCAPHFTSWSWFLQHECFLQFPSPKRRSNQSILKEISPRCSLEGKMLKLKLQYFGHLMRRVDSLEKTLMLGGIGGRRRRVQQGMRWLMASPTWWTWVWVNSGRWWWTGRPSVLQFMGSQRVGHDWATELNWTEDPMLSVSFFLTFYFILAYSQLIKLWQFQVDSKGTQPYM